MKLSEVAKAQHEAAMIVAEAVTDGWPIEAAILMILVQTDDRGLPLPDDVLAWATRGRVSDDSVLPKA